MEKSKTFKRLAFLGLLSAWFLSLQAQKITIDPDSVPGCGLTKEYINSLLNPPPQGGGQRLSAPSVLTTTMTCGRFRLTFQDEVLGDGYGFNDPTYGADYQQCACNVVNYIQSVFDIPAGDGSYIDIVFNQSWKTSINPAPNPNTLAVGGPFFSTSSFTAGTSGFYGGNVYEHFTTGTDPDPNQIDGQITVNFDYTYRTCTQARACGYFDLFSILLHEFTHTLGWLSLVEENSSTFLPQSSVGSDRYSKYDQYFLYYGNIQGGPLTHIVDATNPAAPFIDPSVPANALTSSAETLWLTNVLQYDGSNNQNCPVFGVPNVISASSPPNTISHFNDYQDSYDVIANLSPGFTPDYVMGPYFWSNQVRDVYSLQELRALNTMGYSFTASYLAASSINPSYTNATMVANRHPFTSKYILDASWQTLNAPYYHEPDLNAYTAPDTPAITNCQTQVFDLSTDSRLVDPDGDPVRIFPGSLYNIRGCGAGGNNHNGLSVTSGTGGDVITYTPRADFIGRAQFGFHLYDGKERGSFMIYTIDVTACNACDSNLVINGTFEEGMEVKLIGNPTVENTSIHFYRDMKYTGLDDAIMSDGNIYGNANWTIVRDSKGCDQNEGYFGWDFHSFGSSGTAPAATFADHGDRYYQMFQPNNFFLLCSAPQHCMKYVLEFDYISPSAFTLGAGFTASSTDSNTPIPLNNLTSVPISSGAGWQHASVPVYYCSNTTDAYLVLQNPSGAPFYFYVDNLSFHLDPIQPPLTASITPAASTITCGSSVTLNASVTDNFCTTTYTWMPGNINASSISAGPIADTQYTLTANDGCRTATTTANVTVGPVALAITPSYTTICPGQGVKLTASGAVTYTWSTGSHASVIGVSPTVTTVYTVTGTDAGGCPGIATATVVVLPAPTITISPSFTTICSGSSTTLTASGANTYTWQPGSTPGYSVAVSPTVTTTYTVVGTNTLGCTGQSVVTVSVIALPTLTVSPSIVKICIGQSATLTACCAGSYSWIPSTDLSTTTGSVTVASPTTTTSYTVIGTSGSCTVQAVRDVSVAPLPSLTLTPTSATICAGSGQTFTVSGAATYSWVPGTGLSSTTASVVTASPTTTTIYTVTGTTGGCSSSLTGTVTVLPAPGLTVSPTSATLCSGQSVTLIAGGAVTYTWSPTTGLDLTAINNATETASPTSNIVYTVTGTGSNGCTAQAAVSLTVFATPSLTISPATVSLCAGSSATLTASGGTSYTWQPGGLHTSTISVSPGTTTVYTVSSTNASGCTGQAVRTVSVFALPSVSVSPTTATICSGASQSFTASGAATYSWTPSTGLSATTGSVVNASLGSTTAYTVTGTNAAGCSAKATFTLTVKPTPTVSISPNPATYCIGNPVVLQASGATTYSWSPGTGLSATTGNSVSASPTVTTVYTATGTTNGCSGTATVQVIMSANTCTAAAAKISSPTSYASSTNMGFGSPASIAIMADITFTAGTSSINCNDVRIAPGHQIIVKNGATLSIAASWLHSCSTCGSGMWSGIFVENGGHLNLSGYDVIEDAVNAVSTQTYTSGTLVPDLQIQATIFNKNTNAINLNLGNPNNVQSLGTANIVDNCVFTCRNLSSLATPVPSITNFTAVKSALYNNTGTYGTTTTNAGPRSASGFSLTSAGTTTYPYVIGQAATTTTAGVGAINVYDYLDYGIWAKSSVFEVKNNFFQNLTGNNVSTPFGVGIYEAVTSSAYPVSIGSSLTTAGANEGNVFKTCLRAIDLTGTDLVYIYNNTVNNAATSTYTNFATTGNWSGQYGAFLKPAGTSTTVIHVEGNSISNCALGLHINRSTNYGGTSTTISTNTITAGGTSSLYCNKGVFLEDATGCSSCMTSRTMQVIENTITYAEDKAIHCSNIQSGLLIRCNNELSVTYKSVTNNTITTNATNDVIRLDNCKNTYTEYNANIRTSGGNTSVANSNITGIFIDNSSATGNNNAVSFNTINYVGSCAVWEGDNSTAATFGYNQMKTGRHGLYMYTNAKFTNQGSSTSPSGNRWGNPALTNHTYVDNGGYDYNLTTSIGKIYVLNAGISGGVAPVPTVNNGSPAYNVGTTTAFGIIKISGLEATCPSCECDGGIRGGRAADAETTEIKEVVYNTMKPGNIQQVLEWNERSEGLYAREQQWAGEKWAYGLLSADPSLSQTSKDLKDFYLRMQNSNVARFTEAESDINAGRFESAASGIQSIQPANLQEENLKQVYTIMLNLVQNPGSITDADKATLRSIAGQCTHTGGEAVVKARTLNNRLHNQAMVYADACAPNNNNTLRQDNTATEAGILFNIYPNPGNGEVTVDYDGLNGQDAILSIYDVSGSLLHSTTLPANSKRVQLHAKDLSNGVYMYKVMSNTVTLKTGKIIILK